MTIAERLSAVVDAVMGRVRDGDAAVAQVKQLTASLTDATNQIATLTAQLNAVGDTASIDANLTSLESLVTPPSA